MTREMIFSNETYGFVCRGGFKLYLSVTLRVDVGV